MYMEGDSDSVTHTVFSFLKIFSGCCFNWVVDKEEKQEVKKHGTPLVRYEHSHLYSMSLRPPANRTPHADILDKCSHFDQKCKFYFYATNEQLQILLPLILSDNYFSAAASHEYQTSQ